MKKTGKSVLGHQKKLEKKEHELIAAKAHAELMGDLRAAKKAPRRWH